LGLNFDKNDVMNRITSHYFINENIDIRGLGKILLGVADEQ